MTNMAPPTYRKEVKNFIGVINYYCGTLCGQGDHIR